MAEQQLVAQVAEHYGAYVVVTAKFALQIVVGHHQ